MILPVVLCLFQLSGVERYAVHFVESTQNFVTEEELEIDEVVFISTSRALQSIFIPISLSTLSWSSARREGQGGGGGDFGLGPQTNDGR